MKKRLNRSLGKLILFQFFEYWPYYLGATFCLYGTHWIQSHLPFMAKELADLVAKGGESMGVSHFLWLALGIIIFRTSSRLLFFYPARVLQKELRVELLDRLESVSPTRYKAHNDGQLFQVMSMDMEQLRALIGFALLQIGNIIVAMVVLIPKLNSFNPRLIEAMSPLAIAFILFTLIVSRNRKLYRAAQDLQGEVQNVIIETYAGKKTIKNFHAEKSFSEWFRDYSWKELLNFYKAGVWVSVSMPLLPLGIGCSLLWGAHIVRAEDLGASSLILFSGFVFLFLEPMMFLSWIGVVFSRSYGSWKRIMELVGDLSKTSSMEKRLLKDNEDRNIEKLKFKLDFWERPLDFCVEKNSWSVIVGKTGCGKTHILLQIGDILRLKEKPISYVAQDPYLYNDSIERNIFLGKEETDAEREQAKELLTIFGLDFLADSLDELLKIEVGENGKRLSGGQAKRLILVRSLMGEASILLWDDPFSSVDVILEKQIIDQLKKLDLMKNKTIMMTSHRVTTVRACDDIVYLDKERGVIESGTVQDILKEGTQTYVYFKNQLV